MDYDFLSPRQIVFGWARRQQLISLVADWGKHVYAVIGSRTLLTSGAWTEIEESLRQSGKHVIVAATINREPEVEDVDRLTTLLRSQAPRGNSWLLALGGGAAIDLAKAAAALTTQSQPASVTDYLEGVGRGCQLVEPPLPMVAMPTTAGTGAEATKNSVITSYDPAFKKSLRSNLMVPPLVLVDPQLTVSLPARTTAWTGMDAITQLIESYLTRNARPMARALAVEGLRRALPALPEAVRDGSSRPAREAMSHAALLSGLALANSGLGLAHGVAAALGSVLKTPHGLACAMMLPAALRVNRLTCESQLAELARDARVSNSVRDSLAADTLVDRIDQLIVDLQIPRRLGDIGVKPEQLDALVAGSRGNSMNGNPHQVADAELRELLENML
ncbi:MAG: iron-containing alcohol dehydrogenase [Planctomycetes bacterium]|nr:iron-containing alcohol dehydrogenase [Planctomycetota bacterium]